MLKIMCTADLHFERIPEDIIPRLIEYFHISIMDTSPDIFAIAGDTTDSRNLKAESIEFRNLTRFITQMSNICNDKGVRFIIIKGTPSHDGNVIKNIIEINDLKIEYFDEPSVIRHSDKSILLLPEMYLPRYEMFYPVLDSLLEVNKIDKFDACVFHGMFDFAIPALKQVDSEFNKSRSILIKTDEFQEKYIRYVTFGGHVHKLLKHNNVFYVNRCINEITQEVTKTNQYGLTVFTINDNDYTFEFIKNTSNIVNNFVYLTINKNTTLLELLNSSRGKDNNNTVFIVKMTASKETRAIFLEWKKTINPKYFKRSYISEKIDIVDTKGIKHDMVEVIGDIDSAIKSLYKETYNSDLPDYILDNLKNNE